MFNFVQRLIESTKSGWRDYLEAPAETNSPMHGRNQRVHICSLPVELLHLIIQKVGTHDIAALRLTCVQFYQTASTYRHKTLSLFYTDDGFLIPPAWNTGIASFVRTIELTRSSKKQRKSKPKSRNTIEEASESIQDIRDLDWLLLRDVRALHFLSAIVPQRIVVEYITAWPRLTDIYLSISIELLEFPGFKESLSVLRSLKHVAFDISWPLNADYLGLNVKSLWETVNANSATLESLKVNFCRWDVRRELQHLKAYHRTPHAYQRLNLRRLGFFDNGWPSHDPAELQRFRTYCPIPRDPWMAQLNLKTLQLVSDYINTSSEVFQNHHGQRTNLIDPSMLETLSIVSCREIKPIFFDIGAHYQNLKRLQLVDLVWSEDLASVLPRLRPLEALYIITNKEDDYHCGRFDYDCLDSHVKTLRVFWLEHLEPVGHVAHAGRENGYMDFSSWIKLEELAISRQSKYLTHLIVPRSLVHLRIISCYNEIRRGFCGTTPVEKMQELLSEYLADQVRLSQNVTCSLRTFGLSARYTKQHMEDEPVILRPRIDGYEFVLDEDFVSQWTLGKSQWVGDGGRWSVKFEAESITVSELRRSFPEITIYPRGGYLRWIDAFKGK